MPVTYLLLLGYKCNIFVCSLKTVLVPLDTFLLPAAMMLSFLNRERARKTLEEEKDFLHPNSVCGSQGHSAWGDGRCVGWGSWGAEVHGGWLGAWGVGCMAGSKGAGWVHGGWWRVWEGGVHGGGPQRPVAVPLPYTGSPVLSSFVAQCLW